MAQTRSFASIGPSCNQDPRHHLGYRLHQCQYYPSVCHWPAIILAASDLHAKCPPNSMMKYADYSYLLVGSRHISTVNEEFSHIKAWAASNNLQLNPVKTRELIVYPRVLGASVDPAPILQGAIRVTSMQVLGVTISSNLTMGCHLDEILSSSTSSIHALRVLRSHGLGSPQLFEVARSTTLASMLYASPAWWGFTTAQDRDRLERLMGRLRRGFSPGSRSVIW